MKKDIRFCIEIGRYRGKYNLNCKYETLGAALSWWNGYNIGRGYKKRLVMRWKQREYIFIPALNREAASGYERKWVDHHIVLAKYDSSKG